MELVYTNPGLDEQASQKIIAILQDRLSQEQEAALLLKHAHWNMKGANFIAVHEMLDPEVDSCLEQADETAERIASWADGQTGGQTPSWATGHGNVLMLKAHRTLLYI